MMRFLSHTFSLFQLQWLLVVSVFIMIMLSLLTMDGLVQSVIYALIYTLFYAAIVYGNILWLFPALYQKGKIISYVLSVIVFLLVMGLIRAYVSLTVYSFLFNHHPEEITLKTVSGMFIGSLMIFLLSFVFRMALEYFHLKERSDEIIAQKIQAELNLLKSQVQPHFLFNTLNNIYYEAYLEAPRTAALIERLSDIMRYFVDESPKQQVSLLTEIQFLENYIELEKIRLLYEIDFTFIKIDNPKLTVPPMLLMTFVENIFKHGIDKSSNNNQITIALTEKDNRLNFFTTNSVPPSSIKTGSTGFGLDNLHKRLVLLYQKDFELQTSNDGKLYRASLNIPLA